MIGTILILDNSGIKRKNPNGTWLGVKIAQLNWGPTPILGMESGLTSEAIHSTWVLLIVLFIPVGCPVFELYQATHA